MNPISPKGWTTSEFYVTILGLVLTVLVQAGVLKPADVQTIEGPSNGAITNLVAAAGQILLVYRYLSSRTQLKVEAIQATPVPLLGPDLKLQTLLNFPPPAPSAPNDNAKLAA